MMALLRNVKHFSIKKAGHLKKTMASTISKIVHMNKTVQILLSILPSSVEAPQRDQLPRSMCPWILKVWPEMCKVGNIVFSL